MYKIKNFKSIAQHVNDRIYTDYFYRLMLISKSLFEWHNLPNGIDERWIERYLFTEGECLFFKDPNIGFMVTKLGSRGPLNYYDEPTDEFSIELKKIRENEGFDAIIERVCKLDLNSDLAKLIKEKLAYIKEIGWVK